MTIQQKRIVGLLDIDHTLIFGAEGLVYNDNLIDTLLENGVKDIYLFSSMRLNEDTLNVRIRLVEYLEKKGLTVHGAICASDLVWNKNKKLLKAFDQALREAKTEEEMRALLEQKKFKSLTHFNDAVPGKAFAAVRAGIKGWSSEDAERYQNAASVIRLYLDHKALIQETEKYHLYEMFVRNIPEWAGAVIYVDDTDKYINSVIAMHNQLTPEHKLLTLLNRDENRKVENTKDFYQAIIQPFVELTSLFHAFHSYKFGRQLTHSTAKNEILERAELALEKCQSSEEVAQVRDDFSQEYQRLNHHRFSFWSHAKTRSALVFDNMIEKREEQLQLK